MDSDDDQGDQPSPRRRPFKTGNVGPDGQFTVGKGKPPKHSQFAVGDGRKRGRRPKGQRNFDTEFEEEGRRLITIREGAKARRVSKKRATIVRAYDNAASKGQHQAIRTIFDHSARLADKVAPLSQGLTADDDARIDAWLEQRKALLWGDGQLGDPEVVPGDVAEPRDPGTDPEIGDE